MKPFQQSQNDNRPLAAVIQDVFTGFQNLVRSEIRLARAEFEETARTTGKHLALAMTFAFLGALGLIPFLAFLVIGLGNLLENNYWLSSLIVSIIFISVGSILGIRYARKVKAQDLSFFHIRSSLQNEAHVVRSKVHEISESIQRKAS